MAPNRVEQFSMYDNDNRCRISRAILIPWIVLGFSYAVPGCSKSTPPSASVAGSSKNGKPPRTAKRDSHQQMLNLLSIVQRNSLRSNFFLGDADLKDLQKKLANLPTSDQEGRGVLLFEIGSKHVYLGNLQQGIQDQKEALELLQQAKVGSEVIDKMNFSLGVAYLRLAETENCVNAHTTDSCIFPIRDGGIHTQPEQARMAIDYFQRVLESSPDHLSARWLINLSYMATGDYPDQVPESYLIPPEAFESEQDFPRFLDRAPELGLDTFSLDGGCIVDDFDGDDLLDIVVSSWNPADQIRFFRNQGDGSFVERTKEAGLEGITGGLNLIQADYNNDSHLDILVLRGGWLGDGGHHPNSLLQNDGTGRFRDVTFEAGLAGQNYPTQTAAWCDYDGDGDLDLYIGNEGHPNQLFQNQSDGTFIDVARAARVDDPSFTKGVVWGDFDQDGHPDLYVSNLRGPNRLYRNLGNGTFVDRAPELGVAGPNMSFPVWFWDFNNDGALDLFVASFPQSLDAVTSSYLGLPHEVEMDCLYQGDGKGGFREVAEEMNLRRVSQPMGSNFGDLDNDGFLDFYLGTGFPDLFALVPNLMFRNDGGKRFLDVTSAGGFGHLQKGHGVVFADLDHDGDQDIFHELGGWFAGDAYGNVLFENPGFGNHWIKVKLIGQQSNRSAIGARIRVDIVEGDQQRSIYRWVNSGGSFGGNPLRQHIGLGKAEQVQSLEIFWPTTGQTQRFEDLPADRLIIITEDSSDPVIKPLQPMKFSTGPSSTGPSSTGHDHHHHQHAQEASH